ncbi:polysaccharide deacetylase family protein [Oscillospiraceae bacterium MB08-C2-2]|nr:polysaccharide deacetylase family protein [Oscillospiraceae bacterium MB08-C2-2]
MEGTEYGMMKKFAAAFCAFMILLTGCRSRENNPAQESSIGQNSVIASQLEAIEATTMPEHSVQEFGEPEAIMEYGGYFACKVLYPVTGIPEVDKVIAKWAKGLYEDVSEQVKEIRKTLKDATGTLTVNYNSYRIGERFASVEELGFYTYNGLAHPVEPVKVFNIDLKEKRIISGKELFTSQGTETVLKMLADKILETDASLASFVEEMNPQWLENALLKPDGIEIILERGGYLPGYLGTQRFFFSYEELGDSLAFASELGLTSSSSENEAAEPARAPASQAEIDPEKPMLALTFDDGPSASTARILSLLEQNGARATFFVIGNSVQNRAEVIRQIVEQGSEVANHTWNHLELTRLSEEEMKQEVQSTNDLVEKITGVRPIFLRPPYGSFNAQVKQNAANMGIPMVKWSVDTLDWESQNAKKVHDAIMRDAKNGSIILCHDLYSSTGEAMETVIPELIAQGYQLVTVSELLEHSQESIEAGMVYYSTTLKK